MVGIGAKPFRHCKIGGFWQRQQRGFWPLGGLERNHMWLLKKSLFLKIAEILGIENVYQNGDRRL